MENSITPTQPGELALVETQPIDQNPAAVYLASLKPSGRRSQRAALNEIAKLLGVPEVVELVPRKNAKKSEDGGPVTTRREDMTFLYCNWAALRYQHTEAVRARLVELHDYKTVNRSLCALRGVLKRAWKLKQMTAEDYRLAASVEGIKGESVAAGRGLTPGELEALLRVCENDHTPAGARDAAIIAIMYAAGLRREEVVSLSLASYDQLTTQLVIHGKRNKERTAYLKNGGGRALADWLKIRGSEGDPLFCAINKSGKLDTGQPMTPQAVYNVLQKRAAEAGVNHFSPHDLRRSFISDLLDAGADISVVSKMAGHESVQTTLGYDRRPEAAKEKAAGLLHVPYRGRRLV